MVFRGVRAKKYSRSCNCYDGEEVVRTTTQLGLFHWDQESCDFLREGAVEQSTFEEVPPRKEAVRRWENEFDVAGRFGPERNAFCKEPLSTVFWCRRKRPLQLVGYGSRSMRVQDHVNSSKVVGWGVGAPECFNGGCRELTQSKKEKRVSGSPKPGILRSVLNCMYAWGVDSYPVADRGFMWFHSNLR